LTKQLHDEALKLPLENCKVEITPKILDTPIIITAQTMLPKSSAHLKAHTAKPKMAAKRTSNLAKAVKQLYDLESGDASEKTLNIDLGLYQMENY
jgi:hypothetical protein